MEWLVSHWVLVAQVVIVVGAALYAVAKGQAVELAGKAWGLIVDLASGWLAEIPDSEFLVWAQMIHEALPAWAQIFVSPQQLAAILKKWRDAILETGELREIEAGQADDSVTAREVMSAVESELAEMLLAS